MTKIIYDSDTDSLFLSNKKKTDKIKGSATAGDFILDITQERKIVGLEIKKVSEFLKRLDITRKMLSEIESASLYVEDRNPCRIVIYFTLKISEIEKEYKIPVTIPTYCNPRSRMAVA